MEEQQVEAERTLAATPSTDDDPNPPAIATSSISPSSAGGVGPLSPQAARSTQAVPFLTGNPHTAHQRAVRACTPV